MDERDTSGVGLASAPKVAEALEDVTVVDPACGSGAYLLGMMQELVDLRTALFNVGVDARSLYELKLHIIQRNLYGVDIDEFAVNIAMLRMWLSLVIEYEGEQPEPAAQLGLQGRQGRQPSGARSQPGQLRRPLPLQGPQRRGPACRPQGTAYGLPRPARRRSKKRSSVSRPSSGRPLPTLPRPPGPSIGASSLPKCSTAAASTWRWRILPTSNCRRTTASWDVSTGMSSTTRSSEPATSTSSSTSGGCQLLRSSHGLLAYITSNSWLKAEYGKPLRRYLSDENEPLALLELGKDVFASAIVDSAVLLLRKGSVNGSFPAVDMDHLPSSDFPPDGSLWGRVRPNGEAPWSILSPLEQSVMEKMQTKGMPLGEWDIRTNYGIKTGYNKAFIIDDATKRTLVDKDPNSADIIKPVLRGRDIRRYQAKWAGRWLITTHNGYGHFPPVAISNYPAVKAYLDRSYPQLEKRQDKGRTPYNLRNCVYYKDFAKEKLFWMDIVAGEQIRLFRHRDVLQRQGVHHDRWVPEVPLRGSKQFSDYLDNEEHGANNRNGTHAMEEIRCPASTYPEALRLKAAPVRQAGR